MVPERELIQTLLCPQVFKPYEETLDMVGFPPDNTDLRSSGSNLKQAREDLLHHKIDLVMTKKGGGWRKK